ncbi:glyoxylase I family protein [Abditibacterium utsteinense]|uniref:Glyoxylase I family protein n=1 Tax=Abditibacterium utsteinense TaxID=1960156 RepID=A0A2S8SS18_9BACT|nr:VOC family protein [Abditibacterium utsteinense]PQV63603.1 glyoxylase I family protein [Abditibacterium utsteinense]
MSNQKIKGCGFHHIAIWTSDWDKSLQFYIEALGFKIKIEWGEAPSRAVMLDTGDGNYLEVFERDAAKQRVGEANILHLCFRTDDCAGAVETARSAGAIVTTETFSPETFTKIGIDAKIAFISGPSGEIIEFFECAQL